MCSYLAQVWGKRPAGPLVTPMNWEAGPGKRLVLSLKSGWSGAHFSLSWNDLELWDVHWMRSLPACPASVERSAYSYGRLHWYDWCHEARRSLTCHHSPWLGYDIARDASNPFFVANVLGLQVIWNHHAHADLQDCWADSRYFWDGNHTHEAVSELAYAKSRNSSYR